MKREIISIIFCVILLCTAFENFSAGIQLNVPFNKNESTISENIFLEINPGEKNTFFVNNNNNPIVNITSPENGTYLPTPYLEVLGYAYSAIGLNFFEWTWYWNNMPYYYDNDTFNSSHYSEFRLRINNIPNGTHKIVVGYSDIHNNSSSDSVTVFYNGNLPPEKPDKPSGPNTGLIGVSYSYSTNSTDPNNDKIKYGWDWNGNGIVDQWTNLSNSGLTINTAHTFTSIGLFNITVIAEDQYGAQSVISETLPVTITSNPPNKPIMPSGSSSGKPGVSYTYQTSTTDPDGDNLYYMWDWADETPLIWDGPYQSGQTTAASHIWSTKGTYSIKVKAKDTTGVESTWSDPLPIKMPYTYNPMLQFLELLFQRFPNAFPLLQQLMGY